MHTHPHTSETYSQLRPRNIFQLTLQEMEKSIGINLVNVIDIPVPANAAHTSKLRVAAIYEPGILARVFILNDNTAHIVYYPGVDTNKTRLLTDIPLFDIITEVDEQLPEITNLRNMEIKKHLIIGVYSKFLGFENHFVAITEMDGKLTVINPKGIVAAQFSNPDMEYLNTFLSKDNLHSIPLAAGIQDITDTTSCGYIVAAIHAKTASSQSIFSYIQDINVDTAIAAYDSILKSNQVSNEQTYSEDFDIDIDWELACNEEENKVNQNTTVQCIENPPVEQPYGVYFYGGLCVVGGVGLVTLGTALLPFAVAIGAGGTAMTAGLGLIAADALQNNRDIDQNSSSMQSPYQTPFPMFTSKSEKGEPNSTSYNQDNDASTFSCVTKP